MGGGGARTKALAQAEKAIEREQRSAARAPAEVQRHGVYDMREDASGQFRDVFEMSTPDSDELKFNRTSWLALAARGCTLVEQPSKRRFQQAADTSKEIEV